MLRPITIEAFSDVHMGHSTTNAKKIYEEIRTCFPLDKNTHSDILVLAGDWWDKLLPINHPDSYETVSAIFYLLNYVKKTNKTLLIVDGTPLHDSGQIQMFKTINEHAKINADVILVDDIDIVYIAKYDIHVLFVPDRPRVSPMATIARVHELLKEKQIESVDMAVMHGCFQYQLPQIADDHKHKESDYLDIVKGPIIIGHIHKHSVFERIIAPGSFSRLTHGEEEPKGYVRIEMKTPTEYTATFIENKDATVFITVDVTNLEMAESLAIIDKKIRNLPEGSRVRIQCQAKHPLASDKDFMEMKLRYLDLHFTMKVTNNKDIVEEEKTLFDTLEDYQPLIINKQNITDLILERCANASNSVLKAIPEAMNEIMKEVR